MYERSCTTKPAATSEPATEQDSGVAAPDTSRCGLAAAGLIGAAEPLRARVPLRGAAIPLRRDADPADPLGGSPVAAPIAAALRRRQGGGAPLPDDLAGPMGDHFGQDFTAIRVHADAEAGRIARSLQSAAFTHGNDVYFAPGGYQPGSERGQQVIAHELGHVTAQRTGADRTSGSGLTVGRADDPAERAAVRAADGAIAFLRRSSGRAAGSDGTDAMTFGSRSGQVVGTDIAGAGRTVRRTPVPDVLRRRNPFSRKSAAGKGYDDEVGPRVAGNIGLIREATEAFAVAKPLNNDYLEAEKRSNAWVTKSQQKKITDIASHSQRSKKDTDKRNLKDLLRAYLLKEFTDIIEDRVVTATTNSGDYPLPTKDERKKIDDKYFPVTLRYRDRNAGMIKLGPYAPETMAWMRQEGFDSIVGKSDNQLAVEAGGPRIDVRATFIGSAPLGIGQRMHLFIVYTASDGSQRYFRGGPGPGGFTSGDIGEYEPGTVDWDPSAPSVTVLKGEAAKMKVDGLIEATSQISKLQVPYSGFDVKLNKGGLGGLEAIISGENCNSTAWTILDRAGVPKKKPSGLHPGWGHVLGDLKGEGRYAMPAREGTRGIAAVIKGKPTDYVQVYADRSGVEQLDTVAGGTAVERIYLPGGRASRTKIRFGPDGTIGWVDPHAVGSPPKPRKPGRTFWVNGKANQMIPFFDADGNPVHADGQQPIEVLDDDFVMGGGGMVQVRYSDKYIDEVEGKIDAKYLTDQDPGAVQQPPAIPAVAPHGQADDESDDESDQQDPGQKITVVPGDLQERSTMDGIPLYESDGQRHEYKGINGGSPRMVTPTGRVSDTDAGRMVEFEVANPKIKAWMPASDWRRLFGQTYPG